MLNPRLASLAFMAIGTLVLPVQSDDSESSSASSNGPVREYMLGAWIANYYRPHQVHITGVGLVNKETAYFSTRWGVDEFQEGGHLSRILKLDHDEIGAFHLCHHRNSFFYEVISRDGGSVTIFEQSLLFGNEKKKVWHTEDASPATSLACVDKLLLRASSSSMLAINVELEESDEEKPSANPVSVLFEYDMQQGRSDVITSVATGLAADVFTKARILALIPQNRTLLRLHLQEAHHPEDEHHPSEEGHATRIVAETEIILSGGDGSDGPLSEASLLEPSHVLSVHDTLILADGCSLRQIADGHVRTVVGQPTECTAPLNETVEPVPWASRLSKPEALAGVTEETLEGTILALTGSGVLSVTKRHDECALHTDEEECSAQASCGWAHGEKPSENLCLACDALHEWAMGQGMADLCALELGPRVSTSYNLVGCGCVAPTPEPSPDSDDSDGGLVVFQMFIGFSVLLTCGCGLLVLHRRKRRAALRQSNFMCDVDTAEFHIFTDDESR